MEDRRCIVVGDPHGCLDELKLLLELVGHRPGVDRLVVAGDMIDRGPDSPGVVKLIQDLQGEAILGNHDEKVVRWAKHEETRKPGGKRNPVQVRPEREAEWRRLSPVDLEWLASLPGYIRITPDYLVVHAGFEASRPVAEQSLSRIIRMRYADPVTGDYKSGNHPREIPKGSVDWMAVWPGPESVIYGHAVHSLNNPRIDTSKSGAKCYGIDTGCVFGGHLTAAVLNPDRNRALPNDGIEFFQAKSKRVYFHDASRGTGLD